MAGDEPEQDETEGLSEEAREDSAPVSDEPYRMQRHRWRSGSRIGYVVDWTRPVTHVKWPKGSGKKEFFERLFKPPEK